MSFQPTPLWNPVEVTPPWGWNPAATFLTAYTTAQEEKRAQEEFAVAQELEQFLLPLKKQQAQLSLANMTLQFEKTKGELERQNILKNREIQAVRNANSGFNQGLRDGVQPQQQPAKDPTSFDFSGTRYGQKPASQSPTASQPTDTKKTVSLKGI